MSFKRSKPPRKRPGPLKKFLYRDYTIRKTAILLEKLGYQRTRCQITSSNTSACQIIRKILSRSNISGVSSLTERAIEDITENLALTDS
jgi:hypothetical protein